MVDLTEIKKTYENLDLDSCSTAQDEGWIFDIILGWIKPKEILEIGFYRGGSSFLMLSLSDANVTSVDPIFNITDSQLGRSIEDQYEIHEREFASVEKIQREFKERFKFYQKSSLDIRPDLEGKSFDFMFIDGDHWEFGVRNDFQLCLDLKIPYALVDDWAQPPNAPKSTPTVFAEEFSDKFKVLSAFYRNAEYNGYRIPMVLLKNTTL